MRRVRLIVHRYGILYFAQLHPNCRPVLRRDWPWLVCRRATETLALVLLFEAIKSSLGNLALFVIPFTLRHGLVEVLRQYLLFLQVRDVTRTVVRQFLFASVELSLALLLLAKPLGLGFALMQLVLLFLDEVHKFLDVLERIQWSLLVLLAARAVHELVLLTHQILDNTLQLRIEISLSSIQLEVLDVTREAIQVNRRHGPLTSLLSHACLSQLLLPLLLRLNNLLLMRAKLLLQDLVSNFHFGYFVKVIVHQVLKVQLVDIYLEKRRISWTFSEVALVKAVQIVRLMSLSLLLLTHSMAIVA